MTEFEKLLLQALARILHNQVQLNSLETHRIVFEIQSAFDRARRDEVEALK